MDLSRLDSLKALVQEIGAANSQEKQIELLTKGFELFSLETERLDGAYGSLKEQFRTVNRQLEETNNRLANKVQELHVLTTYLDNILSNMAQGLLFIDFNGNITTYNKAAEHILRVSRIKVLFQSFFDYFPDNLFGYSMKEALLEKNAPKMTYASFTLEDGMQKEIEVDNTFIPAIPSEHQELDFTQGLIVLIRDITEIRKLQVIATRSDRLKELGEMAAQVAHEIRNPLGGIKGFASLLQRDLADNPAMSRMANYIVEGTNSLDRLVAKVLNYSRPLQLHFESVNLFKLLDDLKNSLLADHTLTQNITLTLTSPNAKLILPLDQGLFRGAVLNLLINAFQAMPEGGKVKIDVLEKKNKAIVKICDTGIGIPPENLKKIFNPFFTTKPDGNGLGLPEAYKVIQAHGGEIEVVSSVGIGTCFSIKIPLKL